MIDISIKVIKHIFYFIILSLVFVLSCNEIIKAEELNTIWSQTASLPYVIGGSSSLTFNNRIFLFSGSAYMGGSHDEILQSSVLEFGNLNSWLSESVLPVKLIYQDVKNNSNYFYVLGGFLDNINGSWGSVNSIFRSNFLNNYFTAWVSEFNLPKRLSQGRAAIIGDWIYYAGGWTDYPSNQNNVVYKARINNDGSLGVWDTAGTMPEALNAFGLVSKGNKLIFLGGIAPGNTVVSTVRSAAIDMSSGNISNWTTLAPLPQVSNCQSVAQNNKGVFVIGGWGSGDNLNTVYYSAFDSLGNTSSWQTSDNPLPWKTCNGTASILGEYIYVIGGFALGPGQYGATNVVWKAKMVPEIADITQNPTPTPTQYPTPVPSKIPMLIIPGMGASFNKSLLHVGTTAPNEEWEIASFVNNYDTLIDKLKQEGYEENNNLYIYAYDWRKPISDNALSLKTYIENKKLDKINIIGHSMGGLIGARLGALYPNLINTLVTMGSPFGGSVQAFRILEGADLSTFTGYEKIAISLFLKVNSGYFDSDVQTIQKNIPSFVNVLPIYNYIQKENGLVIPAEKMVWKNNLWPYLEKDLVNIASKSSNIYGSIMPTEYILTVGNRSVKDKVLGRWEDGKPIRTLNGSGDGSVYLDSARFTGSQWTEAENVFHGDLPSSKAALDRITEIFKLTNNSINSVINNFEKALVMAIASPAVFEVNDPENNTYYSQDDILVIKNPVNGSYKIKIKPVNGGGKFSFYFGRINDIDMAWDDFSGEIGNSNIELRFNLDWNKPDLGSDPVLRGVNRLENIIIAMENANIIEGEKQVFKKEILEWKNKILHLQSMDDNRQADLFRSVLQKIKEIQIAWNNRDSQFTDLVIYNLRLLIRDLDEAVGNI